MPDNPLRVIVAEDLPSSRELLKISLEKLGFEVEDVADGQAAWEAYQARPCGAVISDWVMPRMTGLELCRKIREAKSPGYTYFILLTGTLMERGHYIEAMDQGVDDFMTKPASVEALRIRLRVAQRIVDLTGRVRRLEGIVPVCSYCRRIRRDDNVYQQMEAYIQAHTDALFSHGICPDCMKKEFNQTPAGA